MHRNPSPKTFSKWIIGIALLVIGGVALLGWNYYQNRYPSWDEEVRLSDAYRIWYWDVPSPGTGSLSAVALHGVGNKSKLGGPVATIELTEAIEIIAATETAEKSIRSGKWAP